MATDNGDQNIVQFKAVTSPATGKPVGGPSIPDPLKRDRTGTFTNSVGETYKICMVSDDILARIREEGELPVPVYRITTAAGDIEEVPLSDEFVENHQEYAEEWAAYKVKATARTKEYGTKFMDAILYFGMDVKLPEDESWVEEQEMFGLTIPTAPNQHKLIYIKSVVLPGTADKVNAMTAIMKLGDIPEDAVKGIEDSFRSALYGKTPSILDGQIQADEPGEGPVEDRMGIQPEIRTDAVSEDLGIEAQ